VREERRKGCFGRAAEECTTGGAHDSILPSIRTSILSRRPPDKVGGRNERFYTREVKTVKSCLTSVLEGTSAVRLGCPAT
jgi:hypothetical protein